VLLDFLGLLQLLAAVVDAAVDVALGLLDDAFVLLLLLLLEPLRRSSRDLLRIIGFALYGCR